MIVEIDEPDEEVRAGPFLACGIRVLLRSLRQAVGGQTESPQSARVGDTLK
jgi:hypothetical protein